jgi:FKBP-type peptidyl-prolyl cis-trans isomerase
MILKYLIGSSLLICFISCGQKNRPQNEMKMPSQEESIQAGKAMAKQEDTEINAYIKRYNLVMERTGTGLRYKILSKGVGLNASTGMKATVKFKTSLLDGTVCYSSDSTGNETFVVDRDNVESGLHEGIKKLSKGGIAKFILPSHLAHGLTGDNNRIPARSPVVYDIELIDLKE